MKKKSHQLIYELILADVYNGGQGEHILEFGNKDRRQAIMEKGYDQLRPAEKQALFFLNKEESILDIGAGTGRLSNYLQKKGWIVTALDKTDIACRIMRKKGIKRVIHRDLFHYTPRKKFDTAFFIRNYSIFGREKKNIMVLLDYLKNKIIKKSGKLIFVLEEPESGTTHILKRRFVFKNEVSSWLATIFPSCLDMIRLSEKSGWFVVDYKKDFENRYFLVLKNQ